MSAPAGLGDGIWRWALRHPEWHPRTELGAEVASFLVHEGGGTVLIDPLLDDATAAALDPLIAGDVVVAVTIPYHVRSAAEAVQRWGGTVLGHRDVARRLPDGTPFLAAAPGDELPLGIRVHGIARGKEQPVQLPGARALAFGDRIVGVDGGLRYWLQRELTDARRAFYRRTTVPALEPLLGLDSERILVTHGSPVVRDGRRALADALAADPWYHRSS